VSPIAIRPESILLIVALSCLCLGGCRAAPQLYIDRSDERCEVLYLVEGNTIHARRQLAYGHHDQWNYRRSAGPTISILKELEGRGAALRQRCRFERIEFTRGADGKLQARVGQCLGGPGVDEVFEKVRADTIRRVHGVDIAPDWIWFEPAIAPYFDFGLKKIAP
jgi:hypothetical protein